MKNPPDPRLDDEAACQGCDPELWFPRKGGDTATPKRVCRGCPVKTECLEYALSNSERFGIWGGLSERERAMVRRKARTLVGAA